MRFRGKSIRRKIVVLLLVPLVSLVSIWSFASYVTLNGASDLLNVTDTVDQVGIPTEETAQALQRERRQVLVYLADPRRSDAATRLHQAQRRTDEEVARMETNAQSRSLRSTLRPEAAERLDVMLDNLGSLDAARAKVMDSTLDRGGAFQAYNAFVDPCYAFLMSINGLSNVELEAQGKALVGISRAREYLAQEDALMAAALTKGKMTTGDRRAFTDRIAERGVTFETNLQTLPAEDREILQAYWKTTDGRTLRAYEERIIAAGPRGANAGISGERWEAAAATVLTDLEVLSSEAGERYRQRVEPEADRVLLVAGAIGVVGFAAVIASLVISLRIGRSLVRDLNTLRKEANESAGVRLPSVMRRLATGDRVDVETEAPRLDYSPDEMGQVGAALNTLQRAAVEAAVKQADMRRGVSEVFVNLARRNQVLLHRQLTLLDTMERRTEDSDELADLFRLDHLTTRMRRHAEGLVILSGAAPSRQWRKPVQLMDVVRAAVSEVEDYERIEVRRLSRLAVDGSAVADLTHLIAELLENATVFSPPHTAVQVRGERVSNGFIVEIHDRGLGMPPEVLLDANLRLAETPEFELSDTDRLGLFVVARLAQRQGVRVSLQPSPYGGTTAVVLIPGAVLTETPAAESGEERRGAIGGSAGDTDGRGIDVLGSVPQHSLERGPGGIPFDGPVELESALPELDAPVSGGLFSQASTTTDRPGRSGPEQHQQADDAGHRTDAARPAGDAGQEQEPGKPAPLPRRRRSTPVLISDHGRRVGGGDEGREAGQHGEESTGGRRAERSPERETRGETPSATVSGLPRRVRQASLAPQLKKDSADSETTRNTRAPEAAVASERDADEVRSRMASLQRGWQRGRVENASPSGDDSGDQAPGTTPGGDGR